MRKICVKEIVKVYITMQYINKINAYVCFYLRFKYSELLLVKKIFKNAISIPIFNSVSNSPKIISRNFVSQNST